MYVYLRMIRIIIVVFFVQKGGAWWRFNPEIHIV
jgi:hypothetical protein